MSTPSATPGTPSPAAAPVAGPEAAPATGHAPAPSGAPGGRWGALGPVGLVLAGGLSVQFGAALAVSLMPRAGALGVVTLRLAVAAVVLLLVCRPRLRGHSRADWGTVVVFGIAMAGMNGLFYQAVDRIALGPAVTLEVLGPLALSVFASRRAVNLVWAALALAGVFLLSGGGFDSLDPAGAAFALAAGAMWAAYIVFSARTGRRFPQADGLALAMAVGAVLFLPLGIAESGAELIDPVTLALGAGVALLSSVLPYTLELLALRRMPAPTFAILMSLEPAIAAAAGFLVLDQALSATQSAAIALVIAASMGAVRTQVGRGSRKRRPLPGPGDDGR
ncbi:EamA family transporter [Streptomyces lancefieldiae]|uniref:EamA family transporter n=1 Tax=Streptomyces lancefieldiae TaxID=3075520 RepID=A0ABU3AVM4_9ACTN|nr:EamA family transporter [Streptomyces sp. DSM 40712]MDT0614243.1 EamA family transporter [Streptomyces sp. DSM 40712]